MSEPFDPKARIPELTFKPYPARPLPPGFDVVKLARTWTPEQWAQLDQQIDAWLADVRAVQAANQQVYLNWIAFLTAQGFNVYRTGVRNRDQLEKWFTEKMAAMGYRRFGADDPRHSFGSGTEVRLDAENKFYFNYPRDGSRGYAAIASVIKHEIDLRERQKTNASRKFMAAILFLTERGKKADVDFDTKNAVEKANEIAYEEALAKAKAAAAKEPITFDGHNCDDVGDGRECDGWDGDSRRCNCGNRRVSWTSDGDFEDMRVYGEAW